MANQCTRLALLAIFCVHTIAASLPYVGGVNMAGYQLITSTEGVFNGTNGGKGSTPPVGQFAHFAKQGVNVFRIPFPWQLMTQTPGGAINATFFARYDASVKAALTSVSSPYVIVDLHNYARWNGEIIGHTGGPTNEQFAGFWAKLAAKYAGESKIIFGIMNEPHDLGDVAVWADSVQAAVTAIRGAGAVTQHILIPGSSFSAAASLPSGAGTALLRVTDPADSSKSKLLFDVHKYLDSDFTGKHTECVTNGVDKMTSLASWLSGNNRRAFLSETGGGSTASCETALRQLLAYMKSRQDVYAGFTIWSAGAFSTSYELSVTPFANGTDQSIWTKAGL